MGRIRVNDIYIGPHDIVVLSKSKILMYYGTVEEFRRFYLIPSSTMTRALTHGVRWGTLNKNKKVSKAYIDWDKTPFHVVDKVTKEAYIKVGEYENGTY